MGIGAEQRVAKYVSSPRLRERPRQVKRIANEPRRAG